MTAREQRARLTGRRDRGALILTVLVFFAVGAWAAGRYDLRIALEPVTGAAASDVHAYQPEYRRSEGEHLVLLFVGSSTCAASADPALPELVERLKLRLAEYAERRELGFRAAAVAVDWVPARGQDFLEPFGAFDEISLGGNWTSHSLVRQTWDHGIKPVTPAVYILSRNLVVQGDSLSVSRLALVGEQLLVYRQGVAGLRFLVEVPPERYLDARRSVTSMGSGP